MNEKTSISLEFSKLLGEENTYDYQEKVLVPGLKKLHDEGHISTSELEKLADAVYMKGLDIIIPKAKLIDKVTLNTSKKDGFLAEAKLELPGNLMIRNFIKRFSSGEDMQVAIDNHMNLEQHLQDSIYKDSIAPIEFTNEKERILVNPFLDKKTLNEALESQTNKKEEVLKFVIDDYIGLFKKINTPIKESDDSFLTYSDLQFTFPSTLADFNKYFAKNYSSNKLLQNAFSTEIGTELNVSRRFIMHGDLHVHNVLLGKKPIYIDWGSASRNGFFEFDLRKLLTKANLSFDNEDRLVSYAAKKLYLEESEQQKSVVRYAKNRIAQELFATKRYLKAASKSTNGNKDKLLKMANVLYNNVLRRIDRAADKGYLSRDFATLVREYVPAVKDLSVHELENDSYEYLKQHYNPDIMMSQENETETNSLTEIVKNLPNPIERIQKKIQSDRKKYLKKKNTKKALSWIAGSIMAITSLAYVINNVTTRQELTDELEWQDTKSEVIATYKRDFSRPFIQLEQCLALGYSSFQEGLLDFNSFEPEHMTSEEFDSIVKSYNFSPWLINNMMNVFYYYAHDEVGYVDQANVKFLNPLTAEKNFTSYGNSFQTPRENLIAGLEKLSELRSFHFEDKKELSQEETAVIIYDFLLPQKPIPGIYLYNVSQEEFTNALDYEVRRLVETSVRGFSSSHHGGISMKFVHENKELVKEDNYSFYVTASIDSLRRDTTKKEFTPADGVNGKGVFFTNHPRENLSLIPSSRYTPLIKDVAKSDYKVAKK